MTKYLVAAQSLAKPPDNFHYAAVWATELVLDEYAKKRNSKLIAFRVAGEDETDPFLSYAFSASSQIIHSHNDATAMHATELETLVQTWELERVK